MDVPGDVVGRKAVSAVLDGDMTQAQACFQFGLKTRQLRALVAQEKVRRAGRKARFDGLANEWGIDPEAVELRVQQGLQRATTTSRWFEYGAGTVLSLAALPWVSMVVFLSVAVFSALFEARRPWIETTALSIGIALVAAALAVATMSAITFVQRVIFRACAPFAYSVHQLRSALTHAEHQQTEILDPSDSWRGKAVRKQVATSLGRAAHVLDVTRRQGRPHGSRLTRDAERTARRKVAASIARADAMIWDQRGSDYVQALAIIEIAVYETVLRRWDLHDFGHAAAAVRPSPWQRGVMPALNGMAAVGGLLAGVLQVFGPEDQTPLHLIKQVLQSRGWIPR